jgi:hypothetical protein
MGESCLLTTFLTWSVRRWLAAAGFAGATFLLLGTVTAVIPTPVFGRSIPPTDWALEVLIITSVLSGLLAATYVRNVGPAPIAPVVTAPLPDERTAARSVVGAALAFFAIGCPVCNKLVLVALGATGAVQYFAPVQPYLAVAGNAVLAWALLARLRGEMTCALATAPIPQREETEIRSLTTANRSPTSFVRRPANCAA